MSKYLQVLEEQKLHLLRQRGQVEALVRNQEAASGATDDDAGLGILAIDQLSELQETYRFFSNPLTKRIDPPALQRAFAIFGLL